MELLIYCLYPFALLFMLLEWFYKKILHFIYWLMGEPRTPRKRPDNYDDDRPDATETQRKTIEYPERIKQDKGMNPQERTLPYITPEPVKQEPPKKEKPPEFVYEPPKRGGRLSWKTQGNKRQEPDRGMGGR